MSAKEGGGRWRRIEGDGAEWEVRVSDEAVVDTGRDDGDRDVLEFVCVDGSRRPRRIAVEAGALPGMDDRALRHAYLRARPIGGDHYGRPGKTMHDMG